MVRKIIPGTLLHKAYAFDFQCVFICCGASVLLLKLPNFVKNFLFLFKKFEIIIAHSAVKGFGISL